MDKQIVLLMLIQLQEKLTKKIHGEQMLKQQERLVYGHKVVSNLLLLIIQLPHLLILRVTIVDTFAFTHIKSSLSTLLIVG